MNPLKTLLRREWLQHRFAWALLALLPIGLSLLTLSFGQIHLEEAPEDPRVHAALAAASTVGGMAVLLLILGLTSLIVVTGLARRDHADRSVEFWLSMPTAHAPSFAVPLLTHLVLVPLAALVVGLLGGLAVSFVLVGRVAGVGAWFALPWGLLLPAALAVLARLALGVLLAVVWLSPIILAGVLLTAWFRRWGLVILAVGVGLGSGLMDRLLGQPLPWLLLSGLAERAGRSLVNAGAHHLTADSATEVEQAVGLVPSWAAADAAAALSLLASPWLAGALAVSALCFWGLLRWRRAGAGA
jgi:ABC-2 type transport system permease protein